MKRDCQRGLVSNLRDRLVPSLDTGCPSVLSFSSYLPLLVTPIFETAYNATYHSIQYLDALQALRAGAKLTHQATQASLPTLDSPLTRYGKLSIAQSKSTSKRSVNTWYLIEYRGNTIPALPVRTYEREHGMRESVPIRTLLGELLQKLQDNAGYACVCTTM